MTKRSSAEQMRQQSYGNPDKETHYNQWAATYDKDLLSEGYEGPKQAAQLLSSIVAPESTVMDFGCGSGLVGEQLSLLGYPHLYGADISQNMLDIAASRQCYVSLRQHNLETIMVDDIRYDAGICVGVCSFGPIVAEHLAHMIAVLKPGAPLIVSINGLAWEEKAWAQQLDDAQTSCNYVVEYIKTIPYLVDKDIEAKLLIIRQAD